MAEAIASAVIQQLASLAVRTILREMELVTDVDKDVKKLTSSLENIKALLEDAGRREQTEAFKVLMSDLEDISYGMDDVLDEWNSDILKSQIEEDQRGDGESWVVHRKQVCFPGPSSCFFFRQIYQMNRHRDFANRIKVLTEELDRFKTRFLACLELQPNAATSSFVEPRVINTSLVNGRKIHGRDDDKNILVSKLLCESSHMGKGIDVIPIVGMRGLGKTTLAKLVYNDSSVKTHFDERIWVCVSESFDLTKIAEEIIRALGDNPRNDGSLCGLMECIYESIKGTRFLLVLDDVWTNNREEWEQLKRALDHGVEGSRVMVTTCNAEVAEMMGTTSEINLKLLLDDDCWKIIKQLVFEGEDVVINELDELGLKTARMCKGWPFLTNGLGSLLKNARTTQEWEVISHSRLWELKEVEDIFAPLFLSYSGLSSLEKCCFSYCSIFPKDYEIDKDMVVEMWISQGYVGDLKEGQGCFERLVKRFFFHQFEKSDTDGIIISYYKMHDIVHDFAQFLTQHKSVIIEGDNIKEKMKCLNNKSRHLNLLHVQSNSSYEFIAAIRDIELNILKKFRTLLVFSDESGVDYDFVCQNLIGLRSLCLPSLGVRGLNFLPKFSTLIHLRYLNISSNFNLTELPDTLCELCNLQTLKMDKCINLERLPEGIGRLVNLRHLYIDYCWKLRGLPKGIGKLAGLQKLDMLVIPQNKEAYFHFGDLKTWNHHQLQGFLRIKRCENFENVGEAEKTSLIKMKDLQDLCLQFDLRDADPQHEVEILEALKPHENLKVLSIEYYMGTMYASWMTSLINLRYLTLGACSNCEILPPLGKLPCLESLQICLMKSVKKIGAEFLGMTEIDNEEDRGSANITNDSFPKLKKLRFVHLTQLKEWQGSTAAQGGSTFMVMPCLHSLEISSCSSLEVLPDFLQMSPLQYLTIKRCKILQRCCQMGKGKEWHKISHIPSIKIVEEYV